MTEDFTTNFVKRLEDYDEILDVGKANDQIISIALETKIQKILYDTCLNINTTFGFNKNIRKIEWNYYSIKYKIEKLIQREKFDIQKDILNQIMPIKSENRDDIITLWNNLKNDLEALLTKNEELNKLIESDEILKYLKNYSINLTRLKKMLENVTKINSDEEFSKKFEDYESVILNINKYVEKIKKIDSNIKALFQKIENQFENKAFIRDFIDKGQFRLENMTDKDVEELRASDLLNFIVLSIVPKPKESEKREK